MELTVTDQLGKPVEGELSLALVDQALYALFDDTTPEIGGFVQTGATRKSDVHVGHSGAFEYIAVTRKVLKELLDEKDRLARKNREAEQLEKASKELVRQQLALGAPQLRGEMTQEISKARELAGAIRNMDGKKGLSTGIVPGFNMGGGAGGGVFTNGAIPGDKRASSRSATGGLPELSSLQAGGFSQRITFLEANWAAKAMPVRTPSCAANWPMPAIGCRPLSPMPTARRR